MPLRLFARLTAYLIALLLGAWWMATGIVSLAAPLFDFGTSRVGGAIRVVADVFALSAESTHSFAHMLAGLKVLIAVYLFIAIAIAVYDLVKGLESDDAMLDVSLLLAGLGGAAASLPIILSTGESLYEFFCQVVLCVIASVLAGYSRSGAFDDFWRSLPNRRLFVSLRRSLRRPPPAESGLPRSP